jgi:hypothetical protein
MDDAIEIIYVGFVITLAGFIVTHRLNMWREKMARFAAACATFHTAVVTAVAHIPEPEKYWEPTIIDSMPLVATNIDRAVVQFKPFIQGNKKMAFEDEWSNLQSHISQIKKLLSSAEILYGGGTEIALKSKKQFHEHVNRLLEFANAT